MGSGCFLRCAGVAHLGKLIDLYSYPVRTAMRFLLEDKTTGENIIWATNTYERYGDGYRQDNQITPELISGVYANLIQPRILKAEEEQAARTKSKAEVFTPSWVVCYMNNITMAIFNTNEFLRKTFSKTIFGTAALRPEAVCADGFTLSIQASGMHYCIPNEDLSDGNYSKVELSYLSEEVEEFLPFAEDDEAPLATVYGYVPVETVDAVLAKHGGIVNA